MFSKLVKNKQETSQSLKTICVESEVPGGLRRSGIKLCLEARVWARGRGQGVAGAEAS